MRSRSAERGAGRRRRVLVVDDSPSVLYVLRRALEPMDFRVDTVDSLGAALEILAASRVQRRDHGPEARRRRADARTRGPLGVQASPSRDRRHRPDGLRESDGHGEGLRARGELLLREARRARTPQARARPGGPGRERRGAGRGERVRGKAGRRPARGHHPGAPGQLEDGRAPPPPGRRARGPPRVPRRRHHPDDLHRVVPVARGPAHRERRPDAERRQGSAPVPRPVPRHAPRRRARRAPVRPAVPGSRKSSRRR